MPVKPPLILTLTIDPAAFQYFNNLRQKYFPSARNYLDAHLTLFHALPNEAAVIENVRTVAGLQNSFTLAISEPVSIGGGVAFKIKSDELIEVHKNFQKQWLTFLTSQDKQKLWPHITVQNKVTADEAQKLLAELKASFNPFATTATGFELWEYLNGPWKPVTAFFFK